MAEGGLSKSASNADIDDFDENELAQKGVELMLNNEWEEAIQLFMKYKDQSAIMFSGAGWVSVLQSLVSFEEDKMKKAMKLLQDLEKKCSAKNGVFKSLAKKVKGKKKRKSSLEEKLQLKIIMADCIIHQAILTFIKQDISSYIKGGWLIRKAYNIYEKLYKEINKMYVKSLENQKGGVATSQFDENALKAPVNDPPPPTSDITAEYHVTDELANEEEVGEEAVEEVAQEAFDSQDNISQGSGSTTGADGPRSNGAAASTSDKTTSSGSRLSHDTIERLLGSVSLGYGSFQLAISLIPPKILKVIEFLGFDGDRDSGLEALQLASDSSDMKSPLASLGLIWYHTVIRPFFALDGSNVDAGVDEAYVIIERREKQYPKSGLFLFFKARAQRLKCDLDSALATYKTALEFCKGQREMELICYHEIGWIQMMKLNMAESIDAFQRLKQNTRWSKSYYSYLLTILNGANGNVEEAKRQLKDVTALVRNKNNQIESYSLRRAEKFEKTVALSRENCILYMIEVIYLWHAITQCPQTQVDNMLTECNAVTDKSVFHLKCLLEGALYRQKGDQELSAQCFEEAVARRDGMKDDAYVSAYALYELGMTQSINPETHIEGKKNLHKARDGFKDYDFDNRLSVRINAALHRVETEGTPL